MRPWGHSRHLEVQNQLDGSGIEGNASTEGSSTCHQLGIPLFPSVPLLQYSEESSKVLVRLSHFLFGE